MHAFDADRLQGDLVIRQAKPGDLLHALDDHTYHLPSSAIVIADQQGPCSIAGIMGGMASGCSEETINVFVESALFDPIRIALTGRALGILSDSRYRFERGVDPAIVEEGLEQATQMILNLCGGEPGEIVRVGGMSVNVPAESKAHFECPRVGHYGVFSGRRWETQIYPIVRNFVLSAE